MTDEIHKIKSLKKLKQIILGLNKDRHKNTLLLIGSITDIFETKVNELYFLEVKADEKKSFDIILKEGCRELIKSK